MSEHYTDDGGPVSGVHGAEDMVDKDVARSDEALFTDIGAERKDDRRLRNRFRNWSFFAFGVTSLSFFVFTVYLILRVFGCLESITALQLQLMPYIAGFILLAATLGLSIAIALLRYAFAAESRQEKLRDVVPVTPAANLLVEFVDALVSLVKRKGA